MQTLKINKMGVEIGKNYKVNHTRKGKFNLRVTAVNGEWITGIIISGKAQAIMKYNEAYAGEEITIRECLCTLTEY